MPLRVTATDKNCHFGINRSFGKLNSTRYSVLEETSGVSLRFTRSSDSSVFVGAGICFFILAIVSMSCVTVDGQRDVVEDVPSGQLDTNTIPVDSGLGPGGPCSTRDDCLSWVSGVQCFSAVCKNALCHAVQQNDGSVCTDGDPNTQGDSCENGSCTSGVDVCLCATDLDCKPFDDSNPCNGEMRCDGCSCQLVVPPIGTLCNDSDPITWNDQCRENGICAGQTQ